MIPFRQMMEKINNFKPAFLPICITGQSILETLIVLVQV